MKAHKIIEAVQREQKVQYGIKNPRSLIVVTPTYVRTFQALHLTGLMHTLMNLPYDVVWIVVEAGGATNETAALLAKSKVESEMRLKALRVVREQKLDGIVMFADDSNMHSLELFDEIQMWNGSVRFRPDWIKDLDVVVAGDGEDDIGSPLSLVKDASMVEPLGRCGKKVMLWWLRAEARADSKFPSGLVILLKFSSYNHWMILIVLFQCVLA
ncbi:putative 1,4-beta-D-xylan synthase [Helianthus annuus]|nr:putative 1,4-beta-D-xylan synthase [Helianthus annuus]